MFYNGIKNIPENYGVGGELIGFMIARCKWVMTKSGSCELWGTEPKRFNQHGGLTDWTQVEQLHFIPAMTPATTTK